MAKKGKKKMEFSEWMATIEHQSFVCELKTELESQGILMNDIEL